MAKGKVITQFIGILNDIFYIFICHKRAFFGEAIVYLFVVLPMDIYGAIHWLAHRDKKDEIVIVRNNLPWQEWLISSICIAGVSVGIYFVLKALNTSLVVVNTLSFASMLPAMYLLARRFKWNHIAFLINEFIVSILWIWPVAKGDLSFIPIVICQAFQVIYDIYGQFEWIRLEKKQKIQNLPQ